MSLDSIDIVVNTMCKYYLMYVSSSSILGASPDPASAKEGVASNKDVPGTSATEQDLVRLTKLNKEIEQNCR